MAPRDPRHDCPYMFGSVCGLSLIVSFPGPGWAGNLGYRQSPMSYGLEAKSSLQEEGLRVFRDLFPTYFFQEVLQPFPRFSAPVLSSSVQRSHWQLSQAKARALWLFTQLLRSLSPPPLWRRWTTRGSHPLLPQTHMTSSTVKFGARLSRV